MPLKKKPKAKKKVIRKKPTKLKKKPAKRVSAAKKKAPAKKSAPKKLPKKKPVKIRIPGNVVGLVTHYFPHVMAAVIKLDKPLAAGDRIRVKGHTTDFTQDVVSMQMDHAPLAQGKKGQEVGLQVVSRVRQHDVVYKV